MNLLREIDWINLLTDYPNLIDFFNSNNAKEINFHVTDNVPYIVVDGEKVEVYPEFIKMKVEQAGFEIHVVRYNMTYQTVFRHDIRRGGKPFTFDEFFDLYEDEFVALKMGIIYCLQIIGKYYMTTKISLN